MSLVVLWAAGCYLVVLVLAVVFGRKIRIFRDRRELERQRRDAAR